MPVASAHRGSDFIRIDLVSPLLEGNDSGFTAKFSPGLVVGALNNLIDNAIY
jgi:hypothetical protein